MKKALIFGVSGQDGAYLSELLLRKGYHVIGASRDAQTNSFSNLNQLGIKKQVELCSVNLVDFRTVLDCLQRVKPDEIYNFSGQSSVALSFEQPRETFDSILTGTLNLLEVIRFLNLPTRLYNSCSSECFGHQNQPATEKTPFSPLSPYGVAKAAAYWAVNSYRNGYGIYAASGILFNHESPLRPERFVTQKIVSTACRISKGSKEKLVLGDTNIKRDWGWAPDFVQGIHKMLQLEKADDFILATGKSHSLQDFVTLVFKTLNLDWQEFVVVNEQNKRPVEIRESWADPSKAQSVLGWRTATSFSTIVEKMIEAYLAKV